MYSLKETAKAFLAATKIKQSTNNIEIRSAVDAFLASLGANTIIITDDVDPSKKIVITENVEPAGGIVITDDDNPIAKDIVILDDDNPLNTSIQELKLIAKSAKRESLKIACADLIEKLERIIKAVSSLL